MKIPRAKKIENNFEENKIIITLPYIDIHYKATNNI